MDTYARKVRDYLSDHDGQPRAYGYEERKPVGYSQCAHPYLSLVRPAPEARSLSAVLEALTSDELGHRLIAVRHGREAAFLEQEPLVRELVAALARDKDSQPTVEAYFDELFAEMRDGELFEHSEPVMVVLFALKQSGAAYFGSVASVFAESRSSELVHIRRFAISLLDG